MYKCFTLRDHQLMLYLQGRVHACSLKTTCLQTSTVSKMDGCWPLFAHLNTPLEWLTAPLALWSFIAILISVTAKTFTVSQCYTEGLYAYMTMIQEYKRKKSPFNLRRQVASQYHHYMHRYTSTISQESVDFMLTKKSTDSNEWNADASRNTPLKMFMQVCRLSYRLHVPYVM